MCINSPSQQQQQQQSPPTAVQQSERDDDEPVDETILVFYVNGKRIEDRDVDPRTTLVSYLRNTRQLRNHL